MLPVFSALALILASQAYAYATPEQIFDMPPDVQASGEPSAEEQQTKAEIRERIFYRNGETKVIAPTPEGSPEPESPDSVITDPLPVDPAAEQEIESPEPAPPPETELLAPAGTPDRTIEAPVQTAASISPSMTLILSGAVIALIALGALIFGIRRFLARFRPTLSKEPAAPPPIAAAVPESNSQRLEAALGKMPNENPV